MNKKIIAFAGFKGSGKSEATNLLIAKGYTDIKMAAPVKAMLAELWRYNNISEEDIFRRLEGDLKEVADVFLEGKSPRFAMQMLGTEWRNLFSERLWVNMWLRKVEVSSTNVVCSDVRFPAEVETLHSLGGKLIWIHRPGTGGDKHASEQNISHLADEILNNDHDINKLRSEVIRMSFMQ